MKKNIGKDADEIIEKWYNAGFRYIVHWDNPLSLIPNKTGSYPGIPFPKPVGVYSITSVDAIITMIKWLDHLDNGGK